MRVRQAVKNVAKQYTIKEKRINHAAKEGDCTGFF